MYDFKLISVAYVCTYSVHDHATTLTKALLLLTTSFTDKEKASLLLLSPYICNNVNREEFVRVSESCHTMKTGLSATAAPTFSCVNFRGLWKLYLHGHEFFLKLYNTYSIRYYLLLSPWLESSPTKVERVAVP